MNLINSIDNQERYYYLLVPASLSGRPVTFELKVYYYKDELGYNRVDPLSYKFELSVDTDRLGRVVFNVSVRNKGVLVNVRADKGTLRRMKAKSDLLKAALERVGYNLGGASFEELDQKKGVLMQEYEMEGMDITL